MVQGADSTFQPYLQILPEEHDCLLAWTPAEADHLKGSPAPPSALALSNAASGLAGRTSGSQSL